MSKTLQKKKNYLKLFFYFSYVCKLARRHPGSSPCHSPAHTGPAGWRRAAGTLGTDRDRRTARSDRHSLKEGEEKKKKEKRSEKHLIGEQHSCGAYKALLRKCGSCTTI